MERVADFAKCWNTQATYGSVYFSLYCYFQLRKHIRHLYHPSLTIIFLYADYCSKHIAFDFLKEKRTIYPQDMLYLPKVLVIRKNVRSRGYIFHFTKRIWGSYRQDTFYLVIPLMYVTFSKESPAKYQLSICKPYVVSLWDVRALVFKVF